jgi:hypothetical protein
MKGGVAILFNRRGDLNIHEYIFHIFTLSVMSITKITNSIKWTRLTQKEQLRLLEKLTYVHRSTGRPLTCVINYNYIVFYDYKDSFVMTMGLFLPSFEQDLADRDLTVRISPVELELLF